MTDQKAMMEKLAEQFRTLPEIWLQNELLEQTRDYLARGRRFERLKLDQLNKVWAETFRQFVRRNNQRHLREMDDAGAELRLRGEEFPINLVTSEVKQLRAAIQRAGPIFPSAEFEQKIGEFFSDLNKPKH
jgi:hypothetical protein